MITMVPPVSRRWGLAPTKSPQPASNQVGLLALLICSLALSGCGAAIAGVNQGSGSLQASPAAVTFGSVPVGQTASSNLSLANQSSTAIQVTQMAVSGQSFSVKGASDLPITIGAGGTYNFNVIFSPSAAGAASGQLTVTGNGTMVVGLSGTGSASTDAPPTLAALSCASGSITGAGTDNCTVTLSAAAATGGFAVNMASNNSAVTIPASVTVPSGSTSTNFAAVVAAVSTTQSATLTASAGGGSETFGLQLNPQVATVPTLSVSSTTRTFGNVNVNTPATQPLTLTSTGTAPVTVSAATISGAGFTFSGATFPLTLNANQTATLSVQFDPTAAGAVSGSLTFTSNSSTGTSTPVTLSATGVPVPSGLTCAQGSMTGAGSDSCTVTLNAAAASGGFAVNLTSSNSAVTVPGSVTVPAGSASVGFTANVTAFSSAQSVTLTASVAGASQTFSLQLGATAPTLSINATSLAFGNVDANTPTIQPLKLTSTGTAPVIVNAPTFSVAGFTIPGTTFPLTLSPNQVVTLNVQFDPTVAGTVTGSLTITSNSSTNGTAVISLSGNCVSEWYQVNLTWEAPTSPQDPVASYNVYRSPSGGTSYQQVNTTTVKLTSYSDTTVQSGQTYDYMVESVDGSGIASAPSSAATVAVPD